MPIALVVSAVPLRDLQQQSMAVHVCRMPDGSRAKAGGVVNDFDAP
jgi:hypothetical protein